MYDHPTVGGRELLQGHGGHSRRRRKTTTDEARGEQEVQGGPHGRSTTQLGQRRQPAQEGVRASSPGVSRRSCVSRTSKFEGLSIAFFAERAAAHSEALVPDSRRKTASLRRTIVTGAMLDVAAAAKARRHRRPSPQRRRLLICAEERFRLVSKKCAIKTTPKGWTRRGRRR